ncbi:hypothetical protein KCP77_05805 [Salmonella enterica subsp. enterica]|nr:hypothetical protein KCP77_05805 [Salmonella enterica subsp. enterica]
MRYSLGRQGCSTAWRALRHRRMATEIRARFRALSARFVSALTPPAGL